MSAEIVATGNITEPNVGATGSGKSTLNFRLGATPRRKDQQTQQWADFGEPLFLSVTLWEQDADRWANVLQKGSRVTVSGTLALRKWTDREGVERVSMELVGARMLGFFPDSKPQAYGQPNPYQQPANDPWGSQEAPF